MAIVKSICRLCNGETFLIGQPFEEPAAIFTECVCEIHDLNHYYERREDERQSDSDSDGPRTTYQDSPSSKTIANGQKCNR